MGDDLKGSADRPAIEAVDALQQQLAVSQLVMQHAADAIFLLDQDGRTVFANPAAEEMFGWSLAELTGRALHEMVHGRHPDGSPYPMEDCPLGRVFFTGKSLNLHEDTFFHKNGRPVRIACSNAAVYRDGALAGGVLIVRDMTEARRAEDALRESEARLRELNAELERQVIERTQARGLTWQLSPDLMGALNASGRFETSNPAWQSVLGWSEQEVASMSMFEMLHPDDVERTRAGFQLTQEGQPAIRFPNRYRCKDGSYRWISWIGVPEDGMVYCTGRDITAERDQEAQLAARTAERNRIWEMSRDLFAIMGFDGRLKAINPAWEATLGLTQDTLLARDFSQQVHPDDHPRVIALMDRLLAGETVAGFEDRLRHADGSWRWISWTLVPHGDVFYAVGRDVTAEKQAAVELERAQEALRQSQKMEAMGQLTGGVAHDFNNLLTPIVGSLDMLQRRGIGGPREKRLIDGAMQSADRAKTLVQRLLAFARRQPLQASAVDVAKMVHGMADLIASTSGPQIRVVVEAREDLPPAKADTNQLEMALLNLGVNARDAMPSGGTIRITADLDAVEQGHRSRLVPGDYIRLSVADTGVGMDEATLKRAVEPFFSTKGIGKGTGLGLSMVHGLASQLGGALVVQSRPGVGTNVELWLPTSETPVLGEPRKTDAAAPALGRGTALLVDDEELVRASTADMLTDLGYQVVEAESAEQALSLVRDGLCPELLVTDHLMPGMTGTDLAHTIRARLPDLPVLIVSGYAEVDGIAPDLPRLVKPFRNADLGASLAALYKNSRIDASA